MQLVLYAGAHFTEEERLLRCLLKNRDVLSRHGVSVPGPGKYRALLRETLVALETAPPAPAARDILMDLFLDDESAQRVVLHHMFLFGAPRSVVRDGLMYCLAPPKMSHFRALFPEDRVELCFAMRNPATLLPALFEKAPQDSMIEFLRGEDPFLLRWSDTLMAIRRAAPDVTITTWCYEDLPLIWGQIIRQIGGLHPEEKITGAFDLLSDIMSREGMMRFRSYLDSHRDMTEAQKRRVIMAFLDKFAIDEEIEVELNAPGWNDDIINTMTEVYDADMQTVAAIPGVTLLTP